MSFYVQSGATLAYWNRWTWLRILQVFVDFSELVITHDLCHFWLYPTKLTNCRKIYLRRLTSTHTVTLLSAYQDSKRLETRQKDITCNNTYRAQLHKAMKLLGSFCASAPWFVVMFVRPMSLNMFLLQEGCHPRLNIYDINIYSLWLTRPLASSVTVVRRVYHDKVNEKLAAKILQKTRDTLWLHVVEQRQSSPLLFFRKLYIRRLAP